MKWFLDDKVEPYSTKISHGDEVLFFGSCFSDNIVQNGQHAGLKFLNTKFGTIFHPLPLARIILKSLAKTIESSVFEHNDRCYSWDASSKWNGNDSDSFKSEIESEYASLGKQLKTAKFIFITLGTAKEYTLSNGLVVANCHKMPADTFASGLSDLKNLTEVYTNLIHQLHTQNPNLEIVITVSPVRHSKDGLITNNRSKARLLLLCEELAQMDKVSYFPAYEMIVDELRDYRFYSSDLVHPNEEGIKYVWNKFRETYFDSKTNDLTNKVSKYRSYFAHRPINEPTESEQNIRLKKQNELDDFLRQHPQISWK